MGRGDTFERNVSIYPSFINIFLLKNLTQAHLWPKSSVAKILTRSPAIIKKARNCCDYSLGRNLFWDKVDCRFQLQYHPSQITPPNLLYFFHYSFGRRKIPLVWCTLDVSKIHPLRCAKGYFLKMQNSLVFSKNYLLEGHT